MAIPFDESHWSPDDRPVAPDTDSNQKAIKGVVARYFEEHPEVAGQLGLADAVLSQEGEPTGPLNQLAYQVHCTAVTKGWWPFVDSDQNFGEVLALIHSEVSEALEAWRDGMPLHEHHYKYQNPGRPIQMEHGKLHVDTGMRDASGEVVWQPLTKELADKLGVASKPIGVPSEMADIIIRVLDACAAYGIDIDRAVREKMAYNETRPMRHGGKLA